MLDTVIFSVAWAEALFLVYHHLSSMLRVCSLALIYVLKSVQALLAMTAGGRDVLPL